MDDEKQKAYEALFANPAANWVHDVLLGTMVDIEEHNAHVPEGSSPVFYMEEFAKEIDVNPDGSIHLTLADGSNYRISFERRD